MDNVLTFTTFLRDVAGVNTLRVRNEIQSFLPTFASLLTTNDKELDEFVKNTHSANSARPAAGTRLPAEKPNLCRPWYRFYVFLKNKK